MRHGTPTGYIHDRCRCAACTEANRQACLRWSQRRGMTRDLDEVPHGKTSTYSNYGCRCEPCRAANTQSSRVYRQRRRQSAQEGAVR